MLASIEPSDSPTSELPGTASDDFAAAVEAAKLRSLYQFAYGLSHEINNPLANIATRAQTLLVDEADPERRRKLATIVQQAFRAHEMIADLMLFARPPEMRPETTDLIKLADTVVGELQADASRQGTRLVRTGEAGPLLANADPTQIAVALKAIVQNSLEAVKSGGQIEVFCTQYSVPSDNANPQPGQAVIIHPAHQVFTPALRSRSAASPTPHITLTVTDTGPGIPPEIRPHIFDPFFCGREAGRGLGLGLSKAWRIVELHGGQIQVESEAGRGARFTIALPDMSQ
jgi:signal transduction histidine kinase